MAKTRSPEYPAIGLKEAIEKVRAVWSRDYQNKLPKKVMAEHMGYKSLSGASLPILSALSKYGLIEGRGDETRVSDLAVMILAHEPGSPERSRAIGEAFIGPELFVEIMQKFPDGKASDAAIRSYLLTQKFTQTAADAAIRAYRDTMVLVEEESGGHTASANSRREPSRVQQHPAPQSVRGVPASDTQQLTGVEAGGLAGPHPLRQRSMRVELGQEGMVVSAVLRDEKDIDRLIQILTVNKILFHETTEVGSTEYEPGLPPDEQPT